MIKKLGSLGGILKSTLMGSLANVDYKLQKKK